MGSSSKQFIISLLQTSSFWLIQGFLDKVSQCGPQANIYQGFYRDSFLSRDVHICLVTTQQEAFGLDRKLAPVSSFNTTYSIGREREHQEYDPSATSNQSISCEGTIDSETFGAHLQEFQQFLDFLNLYVHQKTMHRLPPLWSFPEAAFLLWFSSLGLEDATIISLIDYGFNSKLFSLLSYKRKRKRPKWNCFL